MSVRSGRHDDPELSGCSAPHESQATTTRRSFVKSVGKKALYVTPVVVTLTANEAHAASPASCIQYGSPCTVHEDCCSLNCDDLSMECKG
jgi:hypothetical protein